MFLKVSRRWLEIGCLSSIDSQAVWVEDVIIASVHLALIPFQFHYICLLLSQSSFSLFHFYLQHLKFEHILKHTHANRSNYLPCTLLAPSLCRSSSSSRRRWTLWLLTWMWRSAAFLWCRGTARRTAAWTSCRRTAPWPSWSPPTERAATTSTPRSPTASSGPLPLWWRRTRCPAPPLTSGGSCTTMAAPRWWCSTSSTSPTLPG